MKTYRKMATIQAEQYHDGSLDLINKYQFSFDTTCRYVLPTLEGNMLIKDGDWIATGIDGEHWVIDNKIFKRTYEEVEE